MQMPEKKTVKKKKAKKPGPHERLKWETARELGLDDDLAKAGDELTVREAGKIGGQMVRKLIRAGQKALADEQRKQTAAETTPDSPEK
jgi:hypothetical protein